MPTELMRFIDQVIGIPLCFAVDLLRRLLSPFFPGRRPGPVKKVLFIKLSEMGSIILAYSLIQRVKRDYPGCEVHFLTFKRQRPCVDMLAVAEPANVMTITENKTFHFVRDTLAAIARLRRERYDLVIDLELFSRFTSILTFLTGAPRRVGFFRYWYEGLYRGDFLTHKVQYNPLIHTSKLFIAMADAALEPSKTTPELKRAIADSEVVQPRVEAVTADVTRLRARLEGLGVPAGSRMILVNPGDGLIPQREWPLEHYERLTKLLLGDPAARVLIIGTGGVSKKAGELRQRIGDARCLDLTNGTTMAELLSLFHIADALVANDCGLAHISSLTPVPKFILFGPESPALYAPLGPNAHVLYSNHPCSPCVSTFNHRKSACADNYCLKAISPESVHAQVCQKTARRD